MTNVSWGSSLAATFFSAAPNPDKAWINTIKNGEFKWEARQYLGYYDDAANISEMASASVNLEFAKEGTGTEKDGSSLPFATTLGTAIACFAMINF